MADTSPPRLASQLVDHRGRPLRDLRISVTDRCNFRCVYCMPREVFGDTLDELEGWGLLRRDRDAIRLTERGLLVGNRVFERFVEPA